jgi:hypothetical protein
MFTRTKLAAALSAASGLLLASVGGGASALASGGPSATASVTVTVNSEISMDGQTSAINFGDVLPGTNAQVPDAETYYVATNDQAGYSLSLTPQSSALQSSGSASIPNSALSVTETATVCDNGTSPGGIGNSMPGAGTGWNFSGNSPVNICTTDSPTPTTANAGDVSATDPANGAAADEYQETWGLSMPAGAPATSYSGTFVYLASAN